MKEAEQAAAAPPAAAGGKGKESLSNDDLARLNVVKPVIGLLVLNLGTECDLCSCMQCPPHVQASASANCGRFVLCCLL